MGIARLPRADLAGRDRLTVPRRTLVAAEILIEYAGAWWGLRRKGLGPTLAAVERPPETDEPRERIIGARMGRAVDRLLSRLPSDSRCLIRAVVLARVLARRGIGSKVVLGVKAGSEFTAHAWVEHCGRPLLPPGEYGSGRLTEL
jgi:hypothetical protein